jgi:hypothetical protein
MRRMWNGRMRRRIDGDNYGPTATCRAVYGRGGMRRRIDGDSLRGMPASMLKKGENPWGQFNRTRVGCVVWLSSFRFDDNHRDEDHPPPLEGQCTLASWEILQGVRLGAFESNNRL